MNKTIFIVTAEGDDYHGSWIEVTFESEQDAEKFLDKVKGTLYAETNNDCTESCGGPIYYIQKVEFHEEKKPV